MKIETYCKNRICPICEDKLFKDLNNLYCKNSCFVVRNGYVFIDINIYEDNFRLMHDRFNWWKKRKINKKINYWKKNDRYLIKLLTLGVDN